jgi:hypothetical protein
MCPVLPASLTALALSEIHEAQGHGSAESLTQEAAARVFHPQLAAVCTELVRHCPTCAAHKPRHGAVAGLYGGRPAAFLHGVGDSWAVDHHGPHPETPQGHFTYVLTCVDLATGFTRFIRTGILYFFFFSFFL